MDVVEEFMDYFFIFCFFNVWMFKVKYFILSLILEFFWSLKSFFWSLSMVIFLWFVDLLEGLRERSKDVEEGNVKGFFEVRVMGEGVVLNNEGDVLGGEFDVVDGGMMSRLIGMCVLWLKFGKFELECDLVLDDERIELFFKYF